MKDIYLEMCEESPIQKEWKPKIGHRVITKSKDCFEFVFSGYPLTSGCRIHTLKHSYKDNVCVITEIVGLEKYGHGKVFVDDKLNAFKITDGRCESGFFVKEDTCTWILIQEDWQKIYWNKILKNEKKTWIEWYDSLEHATLVVEGFWQANDEIKKELPLDEMFLMGWCLFVHGKVYGLKWNWSKSRWEKMKSK